MELTAIVPARYKCKYTGIQKSIKKFLMDESTAVPTLKAS